MQNKDISYLIALSLVPGIGSILSRQLIAHFGSASAVFNAPKGKLLRVPGIGELLSSEILRKDYLADAEGILRDAEDKGVEIICINDPGYPEKLRQIPDAPLYLYWKGRIKGDFRRSVAIVGTRQATEYGRAVTEKIVNELSVYKPVIISGFAYGIDIIAHKAALQEGLQTIAVLGSGLGKIYPSSHKKYVPSVCENGALVTEYSFGTDPDQRNFPARNRIVAGMADAVIVVEAAVGGGALITAELANSYHTDVFAVPGNLENRFSEGCNELISKNIAAIFTSAASFAEMMNWSAEGDQPFKPVPDKLSNLTKTQEGIYKILQHGELHIDDLSWKSQMNMNQLASLLLEMEIMGLVKPLPGKRFKVV